MTDAYGGFSEVYDTWQLLYPKAFSIALAPRITAAVREHGSPRPVLADLACGTGTFALWWQRRHRRWTVYGTDVSPGMIAGARRAARSEGKRATKSPAPARPSFVVQDMRRLELPEPAGVVTCLFDSLNHITREPDLARIFRRVARALAPRGLFLFDLIDELTFPEVYTGTSILDGRDLYVGIDTSYREERGHGIGLARFTFFRRRGARWRRIEFDIRERRWFRGEVREMLSEAGLDLLRLQRIDPYESDEFFVPRTFWVCRKAERRQGRRG